MRSTTHALTLCLVTALTGCKEEPPKRQPPPPEPKAATCDAAARLNDPANVKLFPNKSGAFCLDPTGSDRGYGEGAKLSIDDAFSLFDGEWEIYKQFGVEHVIEAHYVDGEGSGATIDVYLSKYASTESAYAMFTKRTVGDADPAHPDTAKPTKGGGAAALGIGNAYLWRGPFLAELTYNDSKASAKKIEERATGLLPPLVEAMGELLPGKGELPPAAAALPTDKRVPMGIRFITKDLLGVEGTGAGAFGYYADGDKRWRVMSLLHDDKAQAKDVLASFAKLAGANEEKALGDGGWRAMIEQSGTQTEWIIGRKGSRIMAIGDEPGVLRPGMSPEEHGQKTLSQEEKRKALAAILDAGK
jgi:hypothetical protein